MATTERRSGLGRGLAALIPAAAMDEPPEPPSRSPRLEALVADAVAAGLDAVQAVVALDLCAYLHLPVGEGARLHLRAPTMTSLDPTAAFQLFTDISAAAEANIGVADTALGPYSALVVSSAGAQSRGLHAVGRLGGSLTDEESQVLATLCASLGTVVHALDAGARQAGDARPSRIVVEPDDGVVLAEVTVPWGGRLLVGHGRGDAPVDAVAEAVLDAVGADAVPVAALRGVGDESVAVVLIGEAVAAERCGADPLEAVAVAALRAWSRTGEEPTPG